MKKLKRMVVILETEQLTIAYDPVGYSGIILKYYIMPTGYIVEFVTGHDYKALGFIYRDSEGKVVSKMINKQSLSDTTPCFKNAVKIEWKRLAHPEQLIIKSIDDIDPYEVRNDS